VLEDSPGVEWQADPEQVGTPHSAAKAGASMLLLAGINVANGSFRNIRQRSRSHTSPDAGSPRSWNERPPRRHGILPSNAGLRIDLVTQRNNAGRRGPGVQIDNVALT